MLHETAVSSGAGAAVLRPTLRSSRSARRPAGPRERRSRPDARALNPPAQYKNKSNAQWSDSCFSASLHGLPLHGTSRCLHSHVCGCLTDPSSWMGSSLEAEEASLTSFLDEVAEEEVSFSAACFAFHSSECFEASFISFLRLAFHSAECFGSFSYADSALPSFSSGAGEGATEPPVFWSCFRAFSAARISSFCAFIFSRSARRAACILAISALRISIRFAASLDSPTSETAFGAVAAEWCVLEEEDDEEEWLEE